MLPQAWNIDKKSRHPEQIAGTPGTESRRRLSTAMSCGRVTIDGNFDGSLRRDGATANFGDAAEDRGVEIARAAFVANADRHIFQDDKASFVPQRLASNSPLTHCAVTVFTSKIIHASHLVLCDQFYLKGIAFGMKDAGQDSGYRENAIIVAAIDPTLISSVGTT